MMSKLLAVTVMAIGIVCGSSAQGLPQEQGGGAWLDHAKPAAWNEAGAAIPMAPKLQESVNPRCRETARPPQLDEDRRVHQQGWDLVGAYQGGWSIVVIGGTAGYDGMCRPLHYQDFVFVHGVFAGTLAPAPMDSRTDGALSHVSLQSPTQLTAEYSRYEKSDPLCCPSRTTFVTFEIATDQPVVRPVSTSTSRNTTTPPSAAPTQAGLAGTSWQLIKFEGGDGTTLMPQNRASYTIAFGSDGELAARIDCNRGRGTWKSTSSGQIELGPLALTRAQCPPGSLYDQIVKQWSHIRSYVIKDGHLFLALMADGGIYELEPLRNEP
jgi:heat shock protein HslJ